MAAALRFVFGVEAEMEESVVVRAGHKDDVAAAPTVAAAGASTRDEFLTPERKTAITAVASGAPLNITTGTAITLSSTLTNQGTIAQTAAGSSVGYLFFSNGTLNNSGAYNLQVTSASTATAYSRTRQSDGIGPGSAD